MNIERQLAALGARSPADIYDSVRLGTGLAAGFRIYDAPVGDVAVTFSIRGVQSVRLASEVDEGIEARPPTMWGSRIERALELGRPGDLPLDLDVTPFRREVLEAATAIPRGEVRSYGWLARRVDNPGAVRAVGSAMAANPVPLIIPCHRVVRSDGRIGAYSLGGPHHKWKLLRHEGADPDELEALARRGIRFLGSDTTGIFCVPTCRQAGRITDRHRLELASEEQAISQGLRACRVCQPLG